MADWSTGAVARSTLPLLVVLAAVTAIAGCGGEPQRAPAQTVAAPPAAVEVDEAPGTARVTDPARAAYIRRADRICRTLDPERERRLHEVRTASDPVRAYEDTVAMAREQLRRISALRPPAADRDLISHNVLDRLQQRLALRTRLAHALDVGDETTAGRDQAEFEALGIAVRSFARGYGFRDCGAR